MNSFNKFKKSLVDIRTILALEDETWINYSAGINYKWNLSRSKVRPRFVGFFFQCVRIFLFIFIRLSLFKKPSKVNKDIIVFAETLNQWSALETTLNSLRIKGLDVHLLADKTVFKLLQPINKDFMHSINFCLIDVFVGMIFLIYRFKYLYLKLNRLDNRLVSQRLADFLCIYFWLAYFVRLLERSRPKIIFISNDHNSATRSFLLVAKLFNLRTAYLQHAAVSKRFHALDFDYSFLDGRHALDIYRSCEKNSPFGFKPPRERHVFLSGVKRKVTVKQRIVKYCRIGFAVKAADDLQAIIDCLKIFDQRSVGCVYVRTHPSMEANHFKTKISQLNLISTKVEFSNPCTEPLAIYLNKVNVVVSSNSSILLEAALARKGSIYYEFGDVVCHDYYGFVASGVSKIASSPLEILKIVKSQIISKNNNLAVQYYSHTFGTKWEGREGDLVAQITESIFKSQNYKSKDYYELF